MTRRPESAEGEWHDEIRVGPVAAAAEDPVIAAALNARARLDAGFAAQDVEAVEAVSAKDLIVNTPANLVARLEHVIGFSARAA